MMQLTSGMEKFTLTPKGTNKAFLYSTNIVFKIVFKGKEHPIYRDKRNSVMAVDDKDFKFNPSQSNSFNASTDGAPIHGRFLETRIDSINEPGSVPIVLFMGVAQAISRDRNIKSGGFFLPCKQGPLINVYVRIPKIPMSVIASGMSDHGMLAISGRGYLVDRHIFKTIKSPLPDFIHDYFSDAVYMKPGFITYRELHPALSSLSFEETASGKVVFSLPVPTRKLRRKSKRR